MTTPKNEQNLDKKTIGLLPTEKQPELQEIVEFKGLQLTGVAVNDDGRMFASFPRWRKNIPFSVIEIFPNGTYVPYPDKEWNTWNGEPEKKQYASVQSIIINQNYLYVLDSSSPEMKGVLGKAKLYRFDLTKNKLNKKWEFDHRVAPFGSNLSDLVIDNSEQKVFISDSGLGGIIVLDLKTGESKRFLDKHPSTKAEDVVLSVNKKIYDKKVHVNGLALSPIDGKLYYHALTAYNLYRVPSMTMDTHLRDETKIVKEVERIGVTPAPDGMVFDKNGNLYMADLERNAVSYRTNSGEMKILIQDERINWPDELTIDNQNNLIFSDSQVQKTAVGGSVENIVFKIYKVALPKSDK